MTPIDERRLVHAPLGSAGRLLEAFFAAHRAPKGAGARLVLHAGDAAQAAIVGLRPAHRPQDMTPHYKVHWEAEGGDLYPVFDGELDVASDEDYNAFWLVLAGVYAPPGGVAGRLFDVAIGRRIAEATARGLLEEICAGIESAFAAEERAKRVQVSER